MIFVYNMLLKVKKCECVGLSENVTFNDIESYFVNYIVSSKGIHRLVKVKNKYGRYTFAIPSVAIRCTKKHRPRERVLP